MFEVYATRWDSPGIVSQLIPAKGLTFSFPLSAHGEASFSATVEEGRSFWRSSVGGTRSGILIAESQTNGPSIPVWAGRVTSEQQTSERTFSFNAQEWGSALSWFPAPVGSWDGYDTDTYQAVLAAVQGMSGQNLGIDSTGNTRGKGTSVFTVNEDEQRTADQALADIGAGFGPEWYYAVTGSLKNPQRRLVLGDWLGDRYPRVVLEHVANTTEPQGGSSRPTISVLSSLFPGSPAHTVQGLERRGGSVFELRRTRDSDKGATVIVATGDGSGGGKLTATSVAQNLIDAGWPRITRYASFPDVSSIEDLQRRADAALINSAGVLTGYQLATLDTQKPGQPNWRKVTRGSMVRLELDTDVYAGDRPYRAETRLQNITVAVPDDGSDAQVRWDVAEVLEIA